MSQRQLKTLIILCTVALILASVAAYLTFVNRGYAEVCFLDVGQGDSCFIRTERGSSILIDGGDDGSGSYTISPFFLKNFVHELDAVFVSHSHDDHINGILELLDKNFPIDIIYVSENTDTTTKQYMRLKSAADGHNVPIEAISSGEKIEFDEITFTSVASGRPEGVQSDENDNSLILRMDCGENSFLFTGDAGKRLERDIMTNDSVDTDFLKVAHHGSSTSSCSEFVDSVTPELAIISVGMDNRYGHPSAEPLEIFYESDTPVMRTDIDGTITVIMTKDDIKDIRGSRKRGD